MLLLSFCFKSRNRGKREATCPQGHSKARTRATWQPPAAVASRSGDEGWPAARSPRRTARAWISELALPAVGHRGGDGTPGARRVRSLSSARPVVPGTAGVGGSDTPPINQQPSPYLTWDPRCALLITFCVPALREHRTQPLG